MSVHKQEMLQIPQDFMEDKESCSSEELESQKRFNGINRGGLTCCSNDFYNFIYTVEVFIKDALQTYTNNTEFY